MSAENSHRNPSEVAFQLGRPGLNERGFTCCGKPVGCRITAEGCAYLKHPWKRANLFGDTTVRCTAEGYVDVEQLDGSILRTTHRCRLNAGHRGVHDAIPYSRTQFFRVGDPRRMA